MCMNDCNRLHYYFLSFAFIVDSGEHDDSALLLEGDRWSPSSSGFLTSSSVVKIPVSVTLWEHLLAWLPIAWSADLAV
ncbi:hypothetical protein CVT26_015561 [Gymnopilus dilepis]|uniref:Uncharacterized protein n=1 Tax=Gymnopilus dilepis TaxID=231916 RepID=A0A409YD71_9AGAR|nr:hypothetical protein CVT26_015561 [Gymnopilus dilepis]